MSPFPAVSPSIMLSPPMSPSSSATLHPVLYSPRLRLVPVVETAAPFSSWLADAVTPSAASSPVSLSASWPPGSFKPCEIPDCKLWSIEFLTETPDLAPYSPSIAIPGSYSTMIVSDLADRSLSPNYIGAVQVSQSADPSTARLDVYISPSEANNGYGTEAVKRLLNFLFGLHPSSTKPSVHSVLCFFPDSSPAASRVMEKLGFEAADHFQIAEDGTNLRCYRITVNQFTERWHA
ncbi:uncharacterized protein BJ171DRAFT_180218 [Polychytrium aggregatum]|uniref:uncharacterized protein n=1 Tax=Polychytrium aggregatum TaxID=110093 RepID=UPI0022FE13AD|nr:uncharacterized protein BJ171DRAFT_180218 [Polychytrium aggregatum]KAI9202428.1 hypothetical protein BJ171DRAFT_180218 [Polychytrium aggregatum]